MFSAFFLSGCILSLCVFTIASSDKARAARHGARPAADHQKRKVDLTPRQEYRRQESQLQNRKNISTLNNEEMTCLRLALIDMKADGSYGAVASFHGYPGLCPVNGTKRGCCVHGNFRFTMWHRPYCVVVNNLIRSHGCNVSLPYWDWVPRFSSFPRLFGDATFFNPRTNKTEPNPFLSGIVVNLNVSTRRDPQSSLFNTTYFYDKVLMAMEQTDHCQFQTQLEIAHNAIHSRVGGSERVSMAYVDYSAFDPMFFFHHCNIDRLWAFWQALQEYRGLPSNDTSCDSSDAINQLLVPFSTDLNKDEQTKRLSRPRDTFDYQRNFGYKYDSLTMGGMTVPQVAEEINRRQQSERTVAAIPVQSSDRSSNVDILMCDPNKPQAQTCDKKVDEISTFGGEMAPPYTYSTPYLTDITAPAKALGYQPSDIKDIKLDMVYSTLDGVIVNVTHSISDAILLPGKVLQNVFYGLLSGWDLFADSYDIDYFNKP